MKYLDKVRVVTDRYYPNANKGDIGEIFLISKKEQASYVVFRNKYKEVTHGEKILNCDLELVEEYKESIPPQQQFMWDYYQDFDK